LTKYITLKTYFAIFVDINQKRNRFVVKNLDDNEKVHNFAMSKVKRLGKMV